MAEAGWYADPDGRPLLRWWDGDAWSDRRRPLLDDEPEESAPNGAAPWYLRPFVVGAAAVLVFPVGIVLVWATNWRRDLKIGSTLAIAIAAIAGAVALRPGSTALVTAADSRTATTSTIGPTSTTSAATFTSTSASTSSSTTSSVQDAPMCRTAFADTDADAAFHACTASQYDRLQPELAPDRPPRSTECAVKYRGVACDTPTTTTSAPTPAGFGAGTFLVPAQVQPGIYISTGNLHCHWQRRSDARDPRSIVADDTTGGQILVEITATDALVEDDGCTGFTPYEAVDTPSLSIGEGTYAVGDQMLAGHYRTAGGEGCYWARVRNFSGEFSGVIANDTTSAPVEVDIAADDVGFTSKNCGTWKRS